MRSEFEKHYLSLDFYTKGLAQLCLDACSFDEKQDAYLPNMDWILENDADECVTYCCMLNTAYISFKHQQSKVDDLQKQRDSFIKAYDIEMGKNIELQKRVDAVKQLIQDYKDEEKELELTEWEQSTIYGRIAIELEQALKGGEVE